MASQGWEAPEGTEREESQAHTRWRRPGFVL